MASSTVGSSEDQMCTALPLDEEFICKSKTHDSKIAIEQYSSFYKDCHYSVKMGKLQKIWTKICKINMIHGRKKVKVKEFKGSVDTSCYILM